MHPSADNHIDADKFVEFLSKSSLKGLLPNLQKKRIWVKELNKFVTVKVTAAALRTVSKNGTADLAKLVIEKKVKSR